MFPPDDPGVEENERAGDVGPVSHHPFASRPVPRKGIGLRTILAAMLCLSAPMIWRAPGAAAQTAKGIAVEVTNASEPVLCAEKDNIQIDFAAPDVKTFRIQAVHPAYIGTIGVDRYLPDFTASCTRSSEVNSCEPLRLPMS